MSYTFRKTVFSTPTQVYQSSGFKAFRQEDHPKVSKEPINLPPIVNPGF
jgi:hypothetical protein